MLLPGFAVLLPKAKPEASLAKVDEATEHARSAMEKASEIVLAGFKLRAEIRQFLSPERYECKEGRPIWESLSKSLGKSEHNLQIPGEANLLL